MICQLSKIWIESYKTHQQYIAMQYSSINLTVEKQMHEYCYLSFISIAVFLATGLLFFVDIVSNQTLWLQSHLEMK